MHYRLYLNNTDILIRTQMHNALSHSTMAITDSKFPVLMWDHTVVINPGNQVWVQINRLHRRVLEKDGRGARQDHRRGQSLPVLHPLEAHLGAVSHAAQIHMVKVSVLQVYVHQCTDKKKQQRKTSQDNRAHPFRSTLGSSI